MCSYLRDTTLEAHVFDVQNQILDMTRAFDVESFLVGHGHRCSIVFDATHLHALDSLCSIIGQAIALSHSAIVGAEFKAAGKMDRADADTGNGLTRSLFKITSILLDLFLQEQLFNGTTFHAGEIKDGPHLPQRKPVQFTIELYNKGTCWSKIRPDSAAKSLIRPRSRNCSNATGCRFSNYPPLLQRRFKPCRMQRGKEKAPDLFGSRKAVLHPSDVPL